MRIRRVRIAAAVAALAGLACILVLALARRQAAPFAPVFGVGFQGYTNGIMGQRRAMISVTYLSNRAVRVLQSQKIEYGPPLNGDIGSSFPVEVILQPLESFTGIIQVYDDTGPHPPKWRRHLKASTATPIDKADRWWDDWTRRHPWTWRLPYPFRPPPEAVFTSEWLGP